MPTSHLIPRRNWRRILVRIVARLAALYAVVLVVLFCLENRLLFHPMSASRRWLDAPPGRPAHEIDLRMLDGTRIDARWFPCKGAQGAVLICHSRAGNLSLALSAQEVAGWLDEVGVSVLLFDYPGYGRSEGSPSEAGCYQAADAAYEWLTQIRGVPPQEILICGRSLGTAVAVDLASRRPHRALVLISPFTAITDVAFSHLPFVPARLLMHNRFDSLAKIHDCGRPVFMVHGTQDRMVPVAMGEELFAAASEPKRFLNVPGAHHGDVIREEFFPALRRFLNEVEAKSH
jgi:fermentation-respiration switch protein FrsA (DUF1100 family)